MFDVSKKKTLAQMLAMKVEPEGYIYLIHCVGFTYYKIGRTKNLKERLKRLKTAIPFDLKVLATMHVSNTIAHEKFLHNMFKEKRIRREWFDFDNYELDLIKLWFEHKDNRSVIADIWKTNKTSKKKLSIRKVGLRGFRAEIFEAMKAGGITNRESAIGPTAIATLHKEHFGYDRTASQPNISRALKGMSEYVSQARYGKYFVDDKLVNHP